MTARYTAALDEIRGLLASRSQADPVLEARDVWEELTCYPVPSLRTVRRLMEQVRTEAEFGHRGQRRASGRGGQTKGVPVRSTYRMTNREISERLAELERRADAQESRSVEIGADIVAVLDAAARKQGTTRHDIAAFAMLKYVRTNFPDLLHPDMLSPSGSDAPRH